MVTDFYVPYVGGVEQHVRSLSHALVRRGHQVAVATLETQRSGPRLERDGEVTVHRVGSIAQRLGSAHQSADRPWAAPIPDPVVLAGLRRVVTIEQPDVVHGHDWLARSAWPLCIGRRPLVTTLHYFTQSCAKKTLWRDGRPCPGPELGACIRCASDHFGSRRGPAIVVAARLGAAIERRTSSRTISVSAATATGNGVTVDAAHPVVPNLLAGDTPVAAPVARSATAATAAAVPELVSAAAPRINGHRRPNRSDVPNAVRTAGPSARPVGSTGAGLPAAIPDEPFLLYVGDLRTVKGVDVLLDAYRRLDRPPPLVLLGEHHGRPLDDLPAGVVAPGPVPNDVVREVWGRSLFGVVPSVWPEPFGIVVIEAMAAGRTVVASAIGGIPEIVDDGRSGLLVPPGDPRALASAMQRLLDDPPYRSRLEHEARRCAHRYRPDVVAGEVEAVYLDALAEREPDR